MARATRAGQPTLATFQRPLLRAEQFVATRFDTAQAKADFGNQLLAFIAEGFPQKRFTQRFYRVLMQHFGMIAHYDQHGFWAEFSPARPTGYASSRRSPATPAGVIRRSRSPTWSVW
ncbi:hypothetical protein [Roseomonas gilardii]|uniref:hypothetical protein n=1 Tax=Roseomonas gilardii TaxID=257708 RepID=UPI0011A630DD|nr:hypothetical protein [Roseomonas gilardii]